LTPEVPPYRRGGGFGSLGVRFSEAIEPAAVSLWPATVGAWVTLVLVALLLAAALVGLVVRYQKRRYRRLAALELRALSQSGTSASIEAVPAVMKRCALGSFPRERVAALSGEGWREFLDSTCTEQPFAGAAGRTLVSLTTRGASEVRQADVVALFAAAQIWVRRHRAGV